MATAMGKQFNLLCTHVDLRTIEAVIRAAATAELLSEVANDELSALMPLDQLAIEPARAGTVSLFCYLAPRLRPRKVVIERLSEVKTNVDLVKSEVISFWRPFYDGKIIRAGRLYYRERFLEKGAIVERDEHFCAWADDVMKTVRKQLTLSKVHQAYVGDDAGRRLGSRELIVESL